MSTTVWVPDCSTEISKNQGQIESTNLLIQVSATGIILGIETSCDDTAAAIVKNGNVLSNVVSTQGEHALFGGVVPEIASRGHQRLIVPVVRRALDIAEIQKADLDAVSVTYGPGLAGSLLVGVSFAKSLALGLDIPVIGVNHLDGHIASLLLGENSPSYPYLCLIVSGGHTQLMHVVGQDNMLILGKTRDDAAGEAFDKVAKLLSLGFPGGPRIEERAVLGDPSFYIFPRTKLSGYDYSFSGIKTSVLYFLNSFKGDSLDSLLDEHINDICASFQAAMIDMLVEPIDKATRTLGVSNIGVVGGVSANRILRSRLLKVSETNAGRCYVPDIEFSMDNAAMIAMAGFQKFIRGVRSPLTLTAQPNLSIV